MHTDARSEFVENAGMYFERLGLSRTSGRVLGWLLASPENSADAPRLCEALAVAKSSMSVALRQLDRSGLVVRHRPPGARRDHYRVVEDVFGRAFRAKMADFSAFHELVRQGVSAVGDDPAARERLETMADAYGFMAREFPRLLDRWDEERASKSRASTPPGSAGP